MRQVTWYWQIHPIPARTLHLQISDYELSIPCLDSPQQALFWVFSTMEIQHPRRRLSGGKIVIVSPAKPFLPQASERF
jgi:hypothetical protein